MSITPDIADDFAQVTDGLQTIVYRRRNQAVGVELAGCLRRAVTTREAQASGGRYTASDVTWHIPAALLSEAPGIGDT